MPYARLAPIRIAITAMRMWQRCTSSTWATDPVVGTVAFGWHLAGWQRDSLGHGAAPCGLAAGSRHLRPGHGWLPLVVTPRAAGPCGLVTVSRACGLLPLRVATPCWGLSRSRSPLCRGALAAVGRLYKGASHGHARLPLVRVSFATKT
ncbi:hypothetical protein B296_00053106 [Ensete ventricosum]|uniref:Uncharacterized protein n=1 Tax=Ensete ventricosum TaxID=4639 RepID=A0A426WW23_ENSVE|nr:hypothetical protein B296_00053106 [Ensete ventricosum]